MSNSLGGCPLSALRWSFLRSGNYNWNSGGLNNRGSNGNYWSAGSNSATNSYNLNFNSTNLNPRNNNNQGNGFAVRCVAAAE